MGPKRKRTREGLGMKAHPYEDIRFAIVLS